MLFNSLDFLLFFVSVYAVYLLLPFRLQNYWVLLASYFFYACWDFRFLGLLIASTSIAYFCSLGIARAESASRRRLLLILSITADLGILTYFKYWHFFISSIAEIAHFSSTGWDPGIGIILPVGISFYTFHSIGYIVDVYRGATRPPRNVFDYALFVGFFPLLVAGPIERSTHLLPQIQAPRSLDFDRVQRGLCQVLYGLFQKMFIADNLSGFVNHVFSAPTYNGLAVILAVYCFAFQIYCDFSGYTNIALGVAGLLGFDLNTNFNLPYFSQSPAEFWHRWHISLSTWLRDYLYKPLGGSRFGSMLTYRNLMITMILGGLWHGANWTFVVWGAYHGLLLVLHRLLSPKVGGRIPKAVGIFLTFNLVCLGWLFFRAESLSQAVAMLASIATLAGGVSSEVRQIFAGLLFFVTPLIALEVYEWRSGKHFSALNLRWPLQVAVTLLLFYSVVLMGVTNAKTFIYFQF